MVTLGVARSVFALTVGLLFRFAIDVGGGGTATFVVCIHVVHMDNDT